jgi:hypothetical protein
MRIYPHTSLYDIALQEGQISSEESLLEPIFYQPSSISLTDIALLVESHARGRMHWVRAAGSEQTSQILSRMYQRGHTGLLWEYLIN